MFFAFLFAFAFFLAFSHKVLLPFLVLRETVECKEVSESNQHLHCFSPFDQSVTLLGTIRIVAIDTSPTEFPKYILGNNGTVPCQGENCVKGTESRAWRRWDVCGQIVKISVLLPCSAIQKGKLST